MELLNTIKKMKVIWEPMILQLGSEVGWSQYIPEIPRLKNMGRIQFADAVAGRLNNQLNLAMNLLNAIMVLKESIPLALANLAARDDLSQAKEEIHKYWLGIDDRTEELANAMADIKDEVDKLEKLKGNLTMRT